MAAPSTGIIPSPNSAEFAAAIEPSDAVQLTQATRGLWIGGAGNVSVRMAGDNEVATFYNVPAGPLPVRVRQVLATGTTATLITAMF